MLKKVSLLLVCLLVVAAVSSAAFAQEEKATSGSLTIYTAIEDDQLAVYLPVFQEAYPDIEVNIVRDSTGIITARLLAEKDNPQADLVWGLAASSLLVMDAEGMLEPYAPEGLDRVGEMFRDSAEVPAWIGIDVWMSAFCVNTVEMEALGLPMPDSWADLADPVYEGQIVMPNPNSSGTGFLSVSAILQLLSPDQIGTDAEVTDYAGWEYLDALHNNIAQYTHSGSKPCRMAGAGEFPIGISFDYRAVTQANEGEPVVAVFPSEGSGWEMEANSLMKKDEINPAAYTFLDWAISDAAMELYAASYAITSVPTEVPIPDGLPEDPMAQLFAGNDFYWAAANRDAILTEWLARYDEKSEPES